MPLHLRPSAELAERVLLPGDPHRALAVAQALLDGPKMFNHARGLWGYTGVADDGEPLTVQSTGMGGPSAAIVCEELIALGARRLVRIGTAARPRRRHRSGQPAGRRGRAAARRCRARRWPARKPASSPTRYCSRGSWRPGPRRGTVVTTDLFYDPRDRLDWRAARSRARWGRLCACELRRRAADACGAGGQTAAEAAVVVGDHGAGRGSG